MQISNYPTIQSFPWQVSIDAVKDSQRFNSYDDYYQHLLHNLPINSPVTRVKYTNVIQRRFFPDHSLNDTIPIVWKHYQDERILTDLMRLYSLEAEPAVAKFVFEHILSKPPGSSLDKQEIKDFIIETYQEFKVDSYNRLQKICLELGFLGRYDGILVIENVSLPNNAFLILLHDRLAHTPRIVRLTEILEAKWWQYLGLRKVDEIREILHKAEMASLVARFTRVDELEQITTRYKRTEYIRQAMRL